MAGSNCPAILSTEQDRTKLHNMVLSSTPKKHYTDGHFPILRAPTPSNNRIILGAVGWTFRNMLLVPPAVMAWEKWTLEKFSRILLTKVRCRHT
jgi:hypothetical protein